jgi:hypothetical protein
MKKYLLIGLGSLNFLHGSLHIAQFLQSALLISLKEHSELNHLLHNPILSLFWAIIGIFTLYVGIRDFKHHKGCDKSR